MLEWIGGVYRRLKEQPDRFFDKDRPIDYAIYGSPLQRTVILVLVGIVFAGIWVLSGHVTTNSTSQISLFSVLTSGGLSAVLIWVYLGIAESSRAQVELEKSQKGIQEDLTDLQQRQTKIMGAQYEPEIIVIHYSTEDWAPSIQVFEVEPEDLDAGDVVKMKVSNPSQALATNVSLRLDLDYDAEQRNFRGMKLPLVDDVQSEKWSKQPGAVIRGGQSEVPLKGIVGLSDLRLMGEFSPFVRCLERFIDSGGLHRMRIGVYLIYEDQKDDEHEIPIEGLGFAPSDLPDDKEPTFSVVRNHANKIPIDLVEQELLSEGVYAYPPEYR